MIVFSGTKHEFSQQVILCTLAENIERKLEAVGCFANDAQHRAFMNSLPRMKLVLDESKISDDVAIAIEYQIPLTSRRVDFMIGGVDANDSSNIVIIELKQWDRVKKTALENVVSLETYTGGAERMVVHPSQQAYTYAKLIQNFNQSIEEEGVTLYPCAFLHNYDEKYLDQLTGDAYEEIISFAPLFLMHDTVKLARHISEKVSKPSKIDLFEMIENGKLRPSKALQEVVGTILNGNKEFEMIMEQQVAYATILNLIENISRSDKKHSIIIRGGPGTGKSVVAINLLAKLISEHRFSSLYVTQNSAPKAAFKKSLFDGKFSKRFLEGLLVSSGIFYQAKSNSFDCLIVDEAHRLRAKSGFHSNLGENQIKEIINASKISVFFIDEDQAVTTKDIGTSKEIRRWAGYYQSEVHDSPDLTLSSQFRCNGSDGYLAFLDDLLGMRQTANANYFDIDYDIRVFSDPAEMRFELKKKNASNKARMIAGYTHDWVSKDDKSALDFEMAPDFAAQWNFSTTDFGTNPNSFNQIGCIYSTQGLEFEYVGIIIERDLRYENGMVITDRSHVARTENSSGIRKCKDLALADRIIRNIYKTLLTRGQKGCYIYCEDAALGDYIRERMAISHKNNA